MEYLFSLANKSILCFLAHVLMDNTLCRCSFYLHPCEGSSIQILTQGKLSAPRILRVNKVSFLFCYFFLLEIKSFH